MTAFDSSLADLRFA